MGPLLCEVSQGRLGSLRRIRRPTGFVEPFISVLSTSTRCDHVKAHFHHIWIFDCRQMTVIVYHIVCSYHVIEYCRRREPTFSEIQSQGKNRMQNVQVR